MRLLILFSLLTIYGCLGEKTAEQVERDLLKEFVKVHRKLKSQQDEINGLIQAGNAKEVRIKALEEKVKNFVEESKLHQDDREKLLAIIEEWQIQLNDTNIEIIEHANQYNHELLEEQSSDQESKLNLFETQIDAYGTKIDDLERKDAEQIENIKGLQIKVGQIEDHGSRIVKLEKQTSDQKTMIDAHATKIDDLVEKDAEHTENIESLQSISNQIVDQTTRPKNLKGQHSNHTGPLILVAAGDSRDCQVVDMSSNKTCSNLSPYPFTTHLASGGVLYEVPIICGGYTNGKATDKCYKYNISSQTWELLAKMTTPRTNWPIAVINGTLFAAGGYNGGSLSSTEYIYSDGTVAPGPNLPNSKNNHCSVTLHDGRVMIIGSNSYDQPKKVLIFNPKDESFTNGPSLLYNRDYAACTLFKSPMHNYRPVVLAAGGMYQRSAEILDYTNGNAWEEVGSIPTTHHSDFDGPTALPSLSGFGAYLQYHKFFYELKCSTTSCNWTKMQQELANDVTYNVMMYLPTGYTC